MTPEHTLALVWALLLVIVAALILGAVWLYRRLVAWWRGRAPYRDALDEQEAREHDLFTASVSFPEDFPRIPPL
jgi:hypothetical protein